MIIPISEIKVSSAFAATTPRRYKIDKAIEHYKKYGKMLIVQLDKNGYIIDGYAKYIAAKELGLTELRCSNSTTTCYVFGIHPNNLVNKEYVWRVPKAKSWKDWENNILPGDEIKVHAKGKKVPIIVTRIEWLEEPPVKGVIKTVCRDGKVWN